MVELLYFGPLAAIPLSVYLIQTGLRDAPRLQWWRIVAGLFLIGLTALCIGMLGSGGGLVAAFAFVDGLLVACLALIGGVWMLFSLPGWRKTAALLFFPALPAMLYFSLELGRTQSPISKTERNGDLIVQALNDYHADTGSYPEKVEDLEPTYMTDIPGATTNRYANWYKGWLYSADGDDFHLGFTDPPGQWDVEVCYYGSQNPEWECDVWGYMDWGPLPRIPPTLQPCFDDDGEWIDTAACRQELGN